MTRATVRLGFAVGTGAPVDVPLAHTFVTGQTQASGKTTTLQALVARSGRRALAFLTKRGEGLAGRPVRPYLPREGVQPIHWRLVETLLASSLGQRTLKYERLWIINAAKGARSLADVRANVTRLRAKAKGNTADVYTLLGEYLDLILPDMERLGATAALDLQPGLNVMDLTAAGPQLQALVIRAALERINHHEKAVLTVLPEAWEFAPRSRAAPAKDEAVAMARKGAVLENFLLCDSQDIAGVAPELRQATGVWVLGVQRELNELKRTVDSIPAGTARPRPTEVATLGLGQFYACWGTHCVKTYAWPVWMPEDEAAAIARGDRKPLKNVPAYVKAGPDLWPKGRGRPPAPTPLDEDPMTPDQEAKFDRLLDLLTRHGGAAPPPEKEAAYLARLTEERLGAVSPLPADEEALYQRFKARLAAEAPVLLKVLVARPEIEVAVVRETIQADGTSAYGLLALLVSEGFFDQTAGATAAWKEMQRRGFKGISARVYEQMPKLTTQGFLTREGKDGYRAVPEMKKNIRKTS